MRSYNVVMWEPTLSPHKIGLYRALQKNAAIESICYVAQRGLSDERRRLGWGVDLSPTDKILVGPDEDAVVDLIRAAGPDAVHVFSGLRWLPAIAEGLRTVKRSNRRFGILSEPRVLDDAWGALRLAHSWLTEGGERRRTRFVLAIGKHGPHWFQVAGYNPTDIFPFAYFLTMSSPAPGERRRPSLPRIGYLGRLERPKGAHLVLEALRYLPADIEIAVAGSGRLSGDFKFAASSDARLTYHGTIPITDAPPFLRALDILLVPSTSSSDGWGAVVSEALAEGVFVIASDKVGASICLEQLPELGAIVSSPTPQSLAAAVAAVLHTSDLSDPARARRSEWARAHLSADFGAAQMVAILAHVFADTPRPIPFWKETKPLGGGQAL